MTGIYIHIPFCTKKCGYCDFYSQTDLSYLPAYLDALKNQIKSCAATEVDSIYFGGGTPSLLSGAQLGGLIEALRDGFDISDDCEITVEINPASCDFPTLREYRLLGVNRLSVGVQTSVDAALKILGRPHSAADAFITLEHAAGAGFSNISADLMLALPGEARGDIQASIERLAEFDVSHVSVYLLKLSEDTPLKKANPKTLPDEDAAAQMYLDAVSFLAQKGFYQYEISNFAKPGFECRHNNKYWDCRDYIGFGPAAHSSLGGARYSFMPDLKAYLERFRETPGDFLGGLRREGSVGWDDYLMLRLRTNEGLSLRSMERRFGFSFAADLLAQLGTYEAAGLLRFDGDRLSLTTRGMLVSNTIIASILASAES